MRRLILCLDGTWNSSYAGKRTADDGHEVLKPSNTLKLARAVLPRGEDGVEQITYYDIGVGSLAEYPGKAGKLLATADKYLGGLWGGGFEGNVEDALHFLALNYQPGDEVYIFGFSRGAATARAVTTYLDCGRGVPVKNDAYYLPVLFRAYVTANGSQTAYDAALAEINRRRADRKVPQPPIEITPINVTYLGVWDTVLSLGSRILAFGATTTHDERVFHVGTKPSSCVERARHALAVDEMRLDFRPEVWSGHDPSKHRQRWFPGVHSNIGGGYDRDGLANIAFQWVLEGAQENAGLKVDPTYVANFTGRPEHSLYKSSSLGFRIFDKIRFRTGRRSLIDHPTVELDPAVIRRMLATEEQLKHGAPSEAIKTLYRPSNVIDLLAAQPDLATYLASLGITEPLPADVTEAIAKRKARGVATMAPRQA